VPRAIWRDRVLAQSDRCIELEGNVYFPLPSVRQEFLRPSATVTRCAWKGEARYFDVVVDGAVNPDAAWYYPDPSPAAELIRDHVAFWRGVEIID